MNKIILLLINKFEKNATLANLHMHVIKVTGYHVEVWFPVNFNLQ